VIVVLGDGAAALMNQRVTNGEILEIIIVAGERHDA
jgi:hypothetical protein